MEIAIAIVSALSAVVPALFLLHLPNLRQVARIVPVDPGVWPRVSAIVPARDEADRIGPALQSRLADDYPDLEVLVVDDRSEDGTGDVARALAKQDPRVTVVRVDELPDGWLGKTNALSHGVAQASGEFLLFSDADVHIEPGALRTCVALAQEEQLDCLALIPSYATGNWVIEALWSHFLVMLGALLDPAAVARPASRAVVGSGAFTLVRRSAFERTEGFEHLRLETGDDMALAQMLKQSGARCAVLGARGQVSVAIYRHFGEFLRGIEKNGSTTLGAPFPVFALALGIPVLADYAPFLALATGPSWLRALGLAVLALQTAAHCAALASNTGTWWPGVLWPIGTPLMLFGLLRSAWLVRRRGGVFWRGTFYPNDELLAARRYKL